MTTTKANNNNDDGDIRRVKGGQIIINCIYFNLEHYYPSFVFRASSINEILEHIRVAVTFSCFVSLSHSHPYSLAHAHQEQHWNTCQYYSVYASQAWLSVLSCVTSCITSLASCVMHCFLVVCACELFQIVLFRGVWCHNSVVIISVVISCKFITCVVLASSITLVDQ